VGAVITLSRPLDLPEQGIETHLPLNIHESVRWNNLCARGDALQQSQYHQNWVDMNPKRLTLSWIQATFHLKTNIIYSKIISTPLPSASEIIELDNLVIGTKNGRYINIRRLRYRHFRIAWQRVNLVDWTASSLLPPFFNEDAVQSTRFTLCHAILKWRYRNLRILMLTQ
jgi:transcriptional regulatory protein GAL4